MESFCKRHMKQTSALIERVKQVSSTHQHLTLTVDSSLSQLKPGQSLLARPPGSAALVREVWWPVGAVKNRVTVERPLRERHEPGTAVDVIGAVGKPLRFRRTLRNVLLIAHQAEPTPLMLMIPFVLGLKSSITLVLLGSAAQYDTDHLPPEVEVVTGDADFNFPDRVTTIGWADQTFALVDALDEHVAFTRLLEVFRSLRAEVPSNYLFGVFHPPLPCGVGACGACMIRGKGNAVMLACADGPAFDLTEVALR